MGREGGGGWVGGGGGTKFAFDPGFTVLLAKTVKRHHYIGDTDSKRATSRQ